MRPAPRRVRANSPPSSRRWRSAPVRAATGRRTRRVRGRPNAGRRGSGGCIPWSAKRGGCRCRRGRWPANSGKGSAPHTRRRRGRRGWGRRGRRGRGGAERTPGGRQKGRGVGRGGGSEDGESSGGEASVKKK